MKISRSGGPANDTPYQRRPRYGLGELETNLPDVSLLLGTFDAEKLIKAGAGLVIGGSGVGGNGLSLIGVGVGFGSPEPDAGKPAAPAGETEEVGGSGRG